MSTEVLSIESSTGPLQRSFVRDGVAGNYEVIYAMIRIIRDSVNYDKGLEDLSKLIITKNEQDGYSPVEDQLTSIFNYVKSHVHYIPDISGRIESLKSARVTLGDGYGDCDDHANTNASIAGCLGFDDVKIAMAKYSPTSENFAHVYCVVYKDGERFVLDTTLPGGKINDEVKAVEVKEIGVFDDVPGLDGITGVFTNSKYYGKKFGKAALEFLPRTADFLPFGFVANSAFATGAEMLNATGGDTLSVNAIASKINQKLSHLIHLLLLSRIALDSAKVQALQFASQMSAIEAPRIDSESYQIIKQSIKDKLEFIRDFEVYAKENGIKVSHLNSHALLVAGVALTGAVSYMFYDQYLKKRFAV